MRAVMPNPAPGTGRVQMEPPPSATFSISHPFVELRPVRIRLLSGFSEPLGGAGGAAGAAAWADEARSRGPAADATAAPPTTALRCSSVRRNMSVLTKLVLCSLLSGDCCLVPGHRRKGRAMRYGTGMR